MPQNFLKHLAQITQRTVINVDYVLAPEKKGKWAVEECYAVLAWLATDTADFVSSKQFIIGGDSAGANLTAAVSYLNEKNHTHYVEKQFMFYLVLTLDVLVLTLDVDQTKDVTWEIERFGVEDAEIKGEPEANKFKKYHRGCRSCTKFMLVVKMSRTQVFHH